MAFKNILSKIFNKTPQETSKLSDEYTIMYDDANEVVALEDADRDVLEEIITQQMIQVQRLQVQNSTLKKMLETQSQSIEMLRVAKTGYEEAMHIWRMSAEKNLPVEECVEIVRSGKFDKSFQMH